MVLITLPLVIVCKCFGFDRMFTEAERCWCWCWCLGMPLVLWVLSPVVVVVLVLLLFGAGVGVVLVSVLLFVCLPFLLRDVFFPVDDKGATIPCRAGFKHHDKTGSTAVHWVLFHTPVYAVPLFLVPYPTVAADGLVLHLCC